MNEQNDHTKHVKIDSIRRCDGEVFLGFTVHECDQEAVYFPCNTPHECYQFCARHFYFYEHGRYPESEGQREQRE